MFTSVTTASFIDVLYVHYAKRSNVDEKSKPVSFPLPAGKEMPNEEYVNAQEYVLTKPDVKRVVHNLCGKFLTQFKDKPFDPKSYICFTYKNIEILVLAHSKLEADLIFWLSKIVINNENMETTMRLDMLKYASKLLESDAPWPKYETNDEFCLKMISSVVDDDIKLKERIPAQEFTKEWKIALQLHDRAFPNDGKYKRVIITLKSLYTYFCLMSVCAFL